MCKLRPRLTPQDRPHNRINMYNYAPPPPSHPVCLYAPVNMPPLYNPGDSYMILTIYQEYFDIMLFWYYKWYKYMPIKMGIMSGF